MGLNLQQLRTFAQTDYQALCAHLGIDLVPLDIDVSDTELSAGYGGKPEFRIRLRYSDCDLDVAPTVAPTFPPHVWDQKTQRGVDQWPQWRTDLWHETVHQVEHVIFDHFAPKMNVRDEHDWPEWNCAVAYVAGKFPGLPARTLQQLVP